MKSSDRIASVVLMLFGLAVVFESTKLVYTAEFGRPGAGFFPFWLGVAIAVLSVILFFNSRLKSGELDRPGPLTQPRRLRKPAIVVGSMFIMAFLLQPMGFLVTIALWLGFVVVVVEGYRWLAGVPIALLGALGFYMVFEVWLGVPLPIGVLGI